MDEEGREKERKTERERGLGIEIGNRDWMKRFVIVLINTLNTISQVIELPFKKHTCYNLVLIIS